MDTSGMGNWPDGTRTVSTSSADRIRELEAAVQAFLDHEDSHRPGPVVDDPYVGEVQICGDDDCALYWPCPVEELRRAFEGHKPMPGEAPSSKGGSRE